MPHAPTRILLTGATGAMGRETLKQLLALDLPVTLRIFSLDTPGDRAVIEKVQADATKPIEVVWGDLSVYDDVARAVTDSDIILHMGGLVSPAADKDPELTMMINYGGTRHLLHALKVQRRLDQVKFVNIASVSVTGDRMPPIHWGRVGDPVKPAIHDYYAVSKVAAERAVIESGLRDWVSLRQTGMMGPATTEIMDPIILHNPFYNVLEYLSDRDSGRLMAHLCEGIVKGTLDASFWSHIYNIGGGASNRVPTHEMYEEVFGSLGLESIDRILPARWVATRNFHGQYFLDSDVLEDYLHFRRDSMDFFYACYREAFGAKLKLARFLTKLPFGKRILSFFIRRTFRKVAEAPRGTLSYLKQDLRPEIAALWGSREAWEALPEVFSENGGPRRPPPRHTHRSRLRRYAAGSHVGPRDHGRRRVLPGR